jgi:indolepyruvate ferredoxin oxidoreductase
VSDHPEYYDAPSDNGLTINHRDDLLSIEEELREVEGVSVLIYEQTCAAEKRRRRKKGTMIDPNRRIFINDAVCEGCGDCGQKSNCLSVLPKETELGRKRQIDQSACNKDYSCVNGFCPSFVSVIGGGLKKRSVNTASSDGFADLADPELAALNTPWNLVVTGVGGTGVLTITAVLAMAAHIEGKGCATMNQTGLAQKFGPVVSHLRVAKKQEEINAVRIPAGDADLLLGCDLVVSTSDEAIAKVNVERSVAVINDTEMTTADFVYHRDAQFPAEAMKKLIVTEVGEGKVDFIQASEIASNLLGDSLASNFFMLGYAFQKGYIPISSEAIVHAIQLNGVAVEFNQQAFLWGRRAVDNMAAVMSAAGVAVEHWAPLQSLDDIIEFRFQHLIKYQDRAYAQAYRDRVDQVRSAEINIRGEAGDLSEAVARSLHKLMSYKDEYEVARLYSDGEFMEKINASFEGDFKLQFHLAPPIFAKHGRDGLPKKRVFSAWMLKAFTMLAKLKGLRGSVWDIFAYSTERKTERALLLDFNEDLDDFLQNIDADNIALITEIIALVDEIRGFGHVKAQAIAQYRVRRQQLLGRLRGDVVQLVDIGNVA